MHFSTGSLERAKIDAVMRTIRWRQRRGGLSKVELSALTHRPYGSRQARLLRLRR